MDEALLPIDENADGNNTPNSKVTFPLIVVGASLGGTSALKTLVAGLPPDLGASLLIVWHMAPDVRGVLPDILNKVSPLHASTAVDGELIEENRIYVALPDHHLLVEGARLRTTKGPKENRFRPAVDPLFRSAAYNYGANVIGIILTGALDDGTAGLWAIKNYGGIAIVQHPADAEMPSMPESALRHVSVDHSLAVADMPLLLKTLVREMKITPFNNGIMKKDEKMKIEISLAADEDGLSNDVMKLGALSPYTCPECHGVLTSIKEGSLQRFRCHTGHAFSFDSLLSSLTNNVEDNLWGAIRSIKESKMLLNHIGDHYAEANEPLIAAGYFKKAQEAGVRAEMLRNITASHELLSKDNISPQFGETK